MSVVDAIPGALEAISQLGWTYHENKMNYERAQANEVYQQYILQTNNKLQLYYNNANPASDDFITNWDEEEAPIQEALLDGVASSARDDIRHGLNLFNSKVREQSSALQQNVRREFILGSMLDTFTQLEGRAFSTTALPENGVDPIAEELETLSNTWDSLLEGLGKAYEGLVPKERYAEGLRNAYVQNLLTRGYVADAEKYARDSNFNSQIYSNVEFQIKSQKTTMSLEGYQKISDNLKGTSRLQKSTQSPLSDIQIQELESQIIRSAPGLTKANVIQLERDLQIIKDRNYVLNNYRYYSYDSLIAEEATMSGKATRGDANALRSLPHLQEKIAYLNKVGGSEPYTTGLSSGKTRAINGIDFTVAAQTFSGVNPTIQDRMRDYNISKIHNGPGTRFFSEEESDEYIRIYGNYGTGRNNNRRKMNEGIVRSVDPELVPRITKDLAGGDEILAQALRVAISPGGKPFNNFLEKAWREGTLEVDMSKYAATTAKLFDDTFDKYISNQILSSEEERARLKRIGKYYHAYKGGSTSERNIQKIINELYGDSRPYNSYTTSFLVPTNVVAQDLLKNLSSEYGVPIASINVENIDDQYDLFVMDINGFYAQNERGGVRIFRFSDYRY